MLQMTVKYRCNYVGHVISLYMSEESLARYSHICVEHNVFVKGKNEVLHHCLCEAVFRLSPYLKRGSQEEIRGGGGLRMANFTTYSNPTEQLTVIQLSKIFAAFYKNPLIRNFSQIVPCSEPD
jgi:hypothetical protein